MKIIQTPVGHMAVFCYLVYDEETGDGILIDPAGDEGRLLKLLKEKGVKLKYIVNTHGHPDHTCGNGRLRDATGAEIVIHAVDDEFFQRSDLKGWARMLGLDSAPPADVKVLDGEELTFGNITMKFIHTPGHTPGGCCILIDGNLFTGDTLFVGAVGRTDFPGCSFDELIDSLKRLIESLPPETVVWPGHDYGESPQSTLAHEAATNPYILEYVKRGE